ncbi:MAG: ATP-dependent metallopeptidase FtsH/Yme1/Tma family protein, partial [Syntrophobacteraceae bacterium]|nr:ATP-dependent metallopeptidase FtsH/Yme1/Tma family protein [Syntrophobacteraceae bacterium]
MEKIMNRIKDRGEGAPKGSDASQRKVRFSIWYFIAAMLLLSWFHGQMGGQRREKATYSDFKGWVREGRVSDLVVGPET